jgi:hypothetical protein
VKDAEVVDQAFFDWGVGPFPVRTVESKKPVECFSRYRIFIFTFHDQVFVAPASVDSADAAA